MKLFLFLYGTLLHPNLTRAMDGGSADDTYFTFFCDEEHAVNEWYIAASSYTASSSSSSHSAGDIVRECRFNMLKTLVLYLGVSIIHRTDT